MASNDDDLWQALGAITGEQVATEADYEHGYKREMRSDLLRYVTFMISGEIYGLPIEQIVEISTVFPTTPVPRTSEFVIGIGNMRGSVMPVIDLGVRLNLGAVERKRETRVLIVRHQDEPHGIVVERVLEVISLPPEDMESTPGGIGSTRADFILGLGRHRRRLIIILDLGTVLAERDFLVGRYRRERGVAQ
ncbi:purine-binding chemotaxis protein (cheW) [Plesiocystis pacifica SIR-1]|uniref:Purine-binding chemotaxis protein (CheW) n=1 Tax=Plesiocystis pacifica SIR-1 TaxID=391625 RepID=A6G723_9BACT|nr:chemotaxis protein CheW [Plesiocystis pacifica]EDM78299.1 purine-binding chemotaxis protein (cheW) [Plesiocystis pacifica SIR-1]